MPNPEDPNKKLKSKDDLENFFSDMGDEDAIEGEYGKIDQIVDEVMMLLENSGPLTGGIISFDRIYDFLYKSSHPGIEIDTVAEVIGKLRENGIITNEIEVAEKSIYCFQPVQIDSEMEKLLQPFLGQPKRTRAELTQLMGWTPQKLEEMIAKFKQQNLMREAEGLLTLPGL